MKTLISSGANLYAQRNDGFTALHVAAKNNQPKITELLVHAMDDLGIQEVRTYISPLSYAERMLAKNNNGKLLFCTRDCIRFPKRLSMLKGVRTLQSREKNGCSVRGCRGCRAQRSKV